MKTGKTLTELAQQIERDRDAKKDLIADTRSIVMQPHNSSIVVSGDDQALSPTDHCHRQIATWSGIGTRYYQKMREDSPALLAGNVNHWLHKEPEKKETRRMVRTIDGKARAFLSDRYLRLDNEHVAETAFRALENVPDITIASCDVTDKSLYIKAVFPRTEGEVAVGDPVQAGVLITNSEIGAGAFQVLPLVYRLVCLNGMVRASKGNGVRRNHLGAKVESGGVEYQQDTIAAAAKAALLQCRDAVNTFASPDYVQRVIADMQAANNSKPVERPVQAIETLGKVLNLTESEGESILERFIKGQNYTQYGMLNAVTNLANDTDDYDRASELEILGGRVLDLPRSQWERIAVAA